MPARQPFTALCQAIHRPRTSGRADLHIHTTFSDGTYTPAQVVELARRSGLAALAITDHDTLDGIAPTRDAAFGSGLNVIAGVEITTEFLNKELHLLAYFVPLDDADLNAALKRLRDHRTERFWDMVERLRGCGVSFAEEELRAQAGSGALGRRHLAELLVRSRRAGTVREAFQRYLGDSGRIVVPKLRLPVEKALALVGRAGGVASWAHPSYDCTRETLTTLRRGGLDAIEANYPGFRPSRVRELRTMAAELGLAVTAGSDCHGPGHPSRAVGACTLTVEEFAGLMEVKEKNGIANCKLQIAN
jgi:predicted metal-dependent phosphoesterase TrpH